MDVQPWSSSAELSVLCAPMSLYLAPCVAVKVRLLAETSACVDGSAVSSGEAVMKVREAARPHTFARLRVTDTDARSVTLVGEVRECKGLLRRLNGCAVRLRAFDRPLSIEATLEHAGPTRNDWDDFFANAKDMDESKAGERPDTLHLTTLPRDWFAEPPNTDVPSEALLTKAFERFGRVRRVDVPASDPYRSRMKSSISGVTCKPSAQTFEAYVQYDDYSAFVRATDALIGAKLAKRDPDGSVKACRICFDFDRTKHLSDASVKRRAIVRERLVAREAEQRRLREKESATIEARHEADRRKKEESEKLKIARTHERELKRKAKQLAKLQERGVSDMDSHIEREKKKLLKTQRRLQAVRLLDELFRRLQNKATKGSSSINNKITSSQKKTDCKKTNPSDKKVTGDGFVDKLKRIHEQELEEQKSKIQKALEGKGVLRSVLEIAKRKPRSCSISSLSSESEVPKTQEKETKSSRIPQKGENLNPTLVDGGPGSSYPPINYNFGPYAAPYVNPNYGYPGLGGFYPNESYYPEHTYNNRNRGFGPKRSRGAYGGRGGRNVSRSYYDRSETNNMYYKYFKNVTNKSSRDRVKKRSRNRSRSRTRRKSYSRSRSRSSYSKSRSRSRSRSRRRSSSRRRQRYSRSRSYTRSRSKSKSSKRSKSRSSKRSRDSRSKSKSDRRSRSTRSKSNHRFRSRTRKVRSKSKDKNSKSKSPNSNEKRKSDRPRSKSNSKSKDTSKFESNKTPKNGEKINDKELSIKSNDSGAKKLTDFVPRSVRENIDKSKSLSSERILPKSVVVKNFK